MATTANTLTAYLAPIIARTHRTLRRQAILPQVVNKTYEREAGIKGSSIIIPKYIDGMTVSDVTPAEAQPAPEKTSPDYVTLTFAYHRKVNFHIQDSDWTKFDPKSDFIQRNAERAGIALAEEVNSKLFALYEGAVYGWTGTGGTTPFGSGVAISTLANSKAVLTKQKCPGENRIMVLNETATAAALGLDEVRAAHYTGQNRTLETGSFERPVLGFRIFEDSQVPSHTKGTLTNGSGMLAKVNDAAYTVGESTVDIDETSLTGTVTKGDVFTVAGDTQTYVVTTAATAAANAIAGLAFSPASKVAWADNAVVTFKGSYTANLAFHPEAFAFASRPLMDVKTNNLTTNPMMMMTDPVTGIALRLEVIREHKQTVFEYDILYGVKLVDERLAMIVAG